MDNWSVVQIALWLVAGLVSFYFSIGNVRVWTSITVGFFLILIAEVIPTAVPLLPGMEYPQIQALGSILGTIAIMVITHGFQEYYLFTRTLELEGEKRNVYLGVLGVISASILFILINATPDAETLRAIKIVENSCWVFLALINIDMIRKITQAISETPISRGFVAFVGVFVCIFLWKGSALYFEVYHLERLADVYPVRFYLSTYVNHVGNALTSISIGGTFFYLARLLH